MTVTRKRGNVSLSQFPPFPFINLPNLPQNRTCFSKKRTNSKVPNERYKMWSICSHTEIYPLPSGVSDEPVQLYQKANTIVKLSLG